MTISLLSVSLFVLARAVMRASRARALIQAQNVFSLVLNEKALEKRQKAKDLSATITYASIQLRKKN